MTALFDALTPVCIFAIIFGSITAHRYMRHRETIKLIEHGYPPDALRGGRHVPHAAPPLPPLSPPPAPNPPPFAGAFAPPYPTPAAPVPAVYRGNRTQFVWGCILVGVGIALSLALWPIGFAVNAGGTVIFPLGIGPWMVAGFIPLFVGLALLLAYTVGQPPRPPATYLPAPPAHSRHTHEG